jgi:hypothetical protein
MIPALRNCILVGTLRGLARLSAAFGGRICASGRNERNLIPCNSDPKELSSIFYSR